MKKLFSLLALTLVLFTSCEGDPGPPGPQGPPGLDGDFIIGSVFEYEVTFNDLNAAAPSETFEFPSGLEVYDTDVVLAYLLVAQTNDGADVWEPLPRTWFFLDGILLYTFDYTYFDISFYLDGNVDFANLPAEFTDNLIMRVAVLPADLVGEIDTNNMNEVMSVSKFENQPGIVIE